MFQILAFTEAHLATVTTRVEKHGDDDKPAVSLGLEITAGNSILDLIDPTLRPTFYKVPDTKALPGIDEALTVLRCNSVDRVLLPTKHEGWTLAVDDGVDDTKPMVFGGVKCDKFSVEPKQGGTVTLRFRVGTSDLDAARSGMLSMHVGQQIWVTLIAPKAGDEKSLPKGKGRAADATDLFAAGDGPGDEDDSDSEGGENDADKAWPFRKSVAGTQAEAPPQSVTVETSRPGTRTARGREQTKAALAAGAAKPVAKAKYVDKATGSTWSGRGLQPKWLKVALERGKKLADFEVRGS